MHPPPIDPLNSGMNAPANTRTNAPPVRIALIGSKFMGRAHSNAWSQVPKFFPGVPRPVMHTVAARNAAEVDAFATQWGWANSSADWQTTVADDDIDLVDIATPNHAHRDQALAALAAGKHVICEKPLAGDLAAAEEMAAAATASDSSTYVWFNYRRVPAVALAHQMVRNGALGRIYHARATYLQSWGGPDTPLLWRFQGDIAGSGAHGDLNAHIIDAMRFVTGEEIVSVVGAIEHTFIEERRVLEGHDTVHPGTEVSRPHTARSTVDDAVAFLARLSGGGVATFEASRVATGFHNAHRWELHGERGALRFDFERMNELGYYSLDIDGPQQGWTTIDVTRGGHDHPYIGAWWPDSHGLGYEHGFVNQAADVLGHLAGIEPLVPLPDFADALRTQRVLHAAIESAREERPVALT